MRLTGDQQQVLTECLEKCACMKDPQCRKQVVNQLDEDIQDTIFHGHNTRSDILAIVQRCSDYPDGIVSLIKAVGFIENDSQAMEAVYQITVSLFMPDRRLSESFQSRRLLQVPPEVVEDAYRFSVSAPQRDLLGLPSPGSASLWRLLFVLHDTPPQPADNSWLFLSFLKALGRIIKDSEICSLLTGCVDRLETEHGYCSARLSEPVDQAADHPPYALIALNPKRFQDLKFQATTYIFREDADPLPSVERFDATEDELAGWVWQWICETFGEDEQPARVEVFLPRSCLFAVKPHTWPVCDDPEEIPSELGLEYQTVVRLDRIDRKSAEEKKADRWRQSRSKWKQKWGGYQCRASDSFDPDGCIRWLTKTEAKNPRVLLNRLRANDKPLVGFDFDFKSPETKPGLGTALLQAGIPVALWADGCRDQVARLLDGGSLGNLPEALFNARVKAAGEGDELTVSLLWDNPTRILPDVPEKTDKIDIQDADAFDDGGMIGPQGET